MKKPRIKKRKSINLQIANILHYPTTIILIGIGIFFSLIILQVFTQAILDFYTQKINLRTVLAQIFLIFLYVEVIAAIKLYFIHNHHFPLRFFFYIGITDLLRHIIVNPENTHELLLYVVGILILTCALAVLELKSHYLRKINYQSENHEITNFEL
ncbi:MAG: phosphate-starvation-inducible protein PsiE, protein PsiE [Candidatus Peregrinibacteria bacterium GW2011_GWE2_39_6]|nr:MAG: phosphate-starvation-inducible protein PsiE, protein PsiE [Candidatus Peregrinibacteria bacterium GW2011_GWF2_39_17]KKR23437.1 MAG: phosphate-starvation-inducible protein PsiE, protein PsiE [Candidatus Peregrinibacteria bacterium GW2011_GWE2_39_6]HCW32345.1 phosphate-starvation-inducible protein PsiE [Candidatus Peregrinibacteria bacterium]